MPNTQPGLPSKNHLWKLPSLEPSPRRVAARWRSREALRTIGDRLLRLRWIAVPISAYLAITLGLPLANGAAVRGGFVHHAAWVIAGCVAIAAAALIGGIAIDLVRAIVQRLRHLRSHASVIHSGGPS